MAEPDKKKYEAMFFNVVLLDNNCKMFLTENINSHELAKLFTLFTVIMSLEFCWGFFWQNGAKVISFVCI